MKTSVLKYYCFFILGLSASVFGQNYSLNFDGQDDYVDLGDILNELYLPATFQVYVKLDNDGGSIFCTDSDLDDSNDWYFGYYLQVTTSLIYTHYGDGAGNGGGHRRSGRTYVDLDTDIWYSISVVIRGPEDMSIYLDGVSQIMDYNNAGFGGTVGSNSHPFTLGGVNFGNSGNSYFDGL